MWSVNDPGRKLFASRTRPMLCNLAILLIGDVSRLERFIAIELQLCIYNDLATEVIGLLL